MVFIYRFNNRLDELLKSRRNDYKAFPRRCTNLSLTGIELDRTLRP